MTEAPHTLRAGQDDPARGRRVTIASSLGAVLSAFVASLCCVGPLVFALLGLGGAGALVKFEPVRPYLTVATIALLGVGFYFTYRSPKRAEGDECGCPAPRANRTGKYMLWIATTLVIGFLASPYIAGWLFG